MTSVQTVHLQYVGAHPALPASELRIGDVMVWNHGSTSVLVDVQPKGKQSLVLSERTKDGKVWQRTVRATRLIACERAR